MSVTISLERIECVNREDFAGSDEVYYMAILACGAAEGGSDVPSPVPASSRTSLVHETRKRALRMKDGEVASFPPEDRTLYPNPAVPEHRGSCDEAGWIVGPIYFLELDELRDANAPSNQLVTGIVFGHVAGAAAVLVGLMIGGTAGAMFALVLFVGSILAGSLTLRTLLSVIDRDDYLGGYQLSVPVSGPPHEEISFDLTGSGEGILVDDGRKFDATSGKVLYQVTVHVDRS